MKTSRRALSALLCAAMLFMGSARAADGPRQAVDLDLSQVSAVVAFAQVSDMYARPWAYLHSIVRVRGVTGRFVKANGEACDMISVSDASGCCSQGLEFTLAGDLGTAGTYGDEATVTGRFETYEEDGCAYIRLADAYFE
ncbi:MAG: hypothetical protein E7317_09415 [Clostridiales bacterium]|nr:hypothetical protein [Clostridiales bacterium]